MTTMAAEMAWFKPVNKKARLRAWKKGDSYASAQIPYAKKVSKKLGRF